MGEGNGESEWFVSVTTDVLRGGHRYEEGIGC
jgi:hypothetical protein